MSTLTDDALERLLGEAAATYDVPEDGPDGVLAEFTATSPRAPLRGRRWVQAAAVAAVVAGAFAGGALLQAGGDDVSAPTTVASGADEESGEQDLASSGLLATTIEERQTYDGLAAPPAPAAERSTSVGGVLGPDDSAGFQTPNANTDVRTPVAAAPQAPTETAAADSEQPAVQAPAPDGARVVKSGSLALIVADGRVTPTLTAVQELATTAGGVVASAETQESGTTPSGSVTLRVPVAEFERVVTAVRSLDAEVRTATTSGRDVTAEYADVEAQLRTLRAARERFLEILAETRQIGDILAVQQRVDEVSGQIDRLEGQRLVLESQSDMSTLQVTVTEADDPIVRVNEKPDDGLSKAFRDAWDGFTSGVEGIVAASGRALLLLLCLAVAVVVLRIGWRVGRRRLV